MIARLSIVAALVIVAGCATATLPYVPEQQPDGARVSAGYQIAADRLTIEIDTGGRRLEETWIVRAADNVAVRPQAIQAAPVVTGPPPTVGVGVGGGRWGGGIGVGTGVSVGVPVGSGPRRMEGNTLAWFPLEQVGPPPWRLHVKLAGVAPAEILVGGAPTPSR